MTCTKRLMVKLLMLQLLLACISGLWARGGVGGDGGADVTAVGGGGRVYEFGYQPSAEEFDALRIGERVRTWTRDLLAQQRRQQQQRQPNRRSWLGGGGEFVPKFSYERERQRHADMLAWQDGQEHYQHQHHHQHTHEHHDDQLHGASSGVPVAINGGVGGGGGDALPSTLEFNMFSDEVLNAQPAVNQPPAVYTGTYQPVAPTRLRPQQPPAQNGVTIIEIASNEITGGSSNNHHNHNYNNNKNQQNSSLPIYFTNPATGVVYAITEIGRVQGNASGGGFGGVGGFVGNGSIPIYITKQQYDRDMEQLHSYYQQQQQSPSTKCPPTPPISSDQQAQQSQLQQQQQVAATPPSSFSSASNTRRRNATVRPQIIHLPQPVASRPTSNGGISKLPTFELPMVVHKRPKPKPTAAHQVKKAPPTPTTNNKTPSVGVGVGVGPTAIRQQTKRKRKRKNKKTRPPGLYRPSVAVSTTPHAPPQIVRGTRTKPKPQPQSGSAVRPSVSTGNLQSQLEKPNVAGANKPATVFSNTPLTSKRGYMSFTGDTGGTAAAPANHRVRRAALGATPKAALVAGRGAAGGVVVAVNGTKAARRISKTPKPRKTQRRKVPTTGRLPQPKDKTNSEPMQRWHNALTLAHIAGVFPGNKSSSDGSSSTPDTGHHPNKDVQDVLSKDISHKAQHKRAKNKAKAGGGGGGDDDDGGDDLIDLLDELTGNGKKDDASHHNVNGGNAKAPKANSSGDSDDDDDDDDEDDDEEEDDDDDDGTSGDDLREDVTQSDSSSAEESADFGALEGGDGADDDVDIIWSTTTTKYSAAAAAAPSKKRIRRRPAPAKLSKEDDYDDDDYDDDDGGIGGIGGGGGGAMGGFFRMIFYPVQAMMSRLFAADDYDGGGGSDEDVAAAASATAPQYPTYTLYHNALAHAPNAISSSAESSDEQSGGGGVASSIGDWFSSWFGFNRREKNIGSTTKAPPPAIVAPQAAPPTPRPSGWFESWFGFGGTSAESESNGHDDDADDDKWFFGWFDTKPKAHRRTSTTTTSTTTSASPLMPQVPILTIVDPLRNPQNWIGILAQHLANATTTTHHPLLEAVTRATTTSTSTSTANPDIPRRITYDKYQIWRLKPQDDGQVKALVELKRSEEGSKLQWLKGPSLRGLTDVLVPPRMLVDLRATLTFETIAHEVLIFDVGKAIAYEKAKEAVYLQANATRQQLKATGAPMSWHKYHEFDAIVKYAEWLRLKHPQLVELVHIGRSYEGRPLLIVKLEVQQRPSNGAAANVAAAVAGGSGGTGVVHKKLKYRKKSGQANAVFIEAGTHGVEWIGPATATWMINEVLRIMRSNKTGAEHDFIRKTTWYIMPVLNPDGYVYTHEYDRFWRKTRSRHIAQPGGGLIDSAMHWLQQKRRLREKICYGVDLDRNWAYEWGRRGGSKAACNEFYAGPMPFSEPETKAVSEFLMAQRKRIKLFVSLQAYGQVISFPIRANASFNSERMEDFLDVAMVGTDGLRKRGSKTRYKVDTTSDLLERRSGCSDAFVAYEVGVPFSYTLQLADNGVHGYLLPGSSIEQTARDSFEIITSMLDYL